MSASQPPDERKVKIGASGKGAQANDNEVNRDTGTEIDASGEGASASRNKVGSTPITLSRTQQAAVAIAAAVIGAVGLMLSTDAGQEFLGLREPVETPVTGAGASAAPVKAAEDKAPTE